jgi:signal transduction histidine kinase
VKRFQRASAKDPRVDQLRKLSDINRAFSYTTSLEQVAQLTVVRGADLLDAKAAVLMLQDSDDLLQVRAAFGIPDESVARFRAPLTDELIARLQGLLESKDGSFVAVPLVVGGAVTGVVAVALTRPSTEPDEWLLSALADQAAVALQNARIGGEVRIDLEERLRVSEGATNAKDRALSTLAHDIRSPLGAIEGYCAIMEDGMFGPVTDQQRDALGRVRMSGRHLLSLLDNVMDMARLTAGLVSVHSEPVRVFDVARDAVDILIPASYAKRQRLELGECADVTVRGDSSRLRQVLVNLIGNSVKFTAPDGSVIVSTSELAIDGRMWGEIRVTDTGPGIAESDRVAIFEPYFRSAGTGGIPGVGLGLAISAALVVQMGGRLEVESEVGVGSSFTIRLPRLAELSIS